VTVANVDEPLGEAFEMLVEEVWVLQGRPYPIVTGPIVSGAVRVGDRVTLGGVPSSSSAPSRSAQNAGSTGAVSAPIGT
jgi:translation elongation factor EF-Tu-like GTPase